MLHGSLVRAYVRASCWTVSIVLLIINIVLFLLINNFVLIRMLCFKMPPQVVGPFESLVANGASVKANVQVVVIVALELFCSAERTDWNLKNIAENAFVSQIILFSV